MSEKKDNEYIATEDDAIKGVGVACYKMLLDGAGGCYYAMIMGSNNWNIGGYLNAVTGWNKQVLRCHPSHISHL